MRILICGGRTLNLRVGIALIHRAIHHKNLKPTCIISGGAKGADTSAILYAKNRGIHCEIYQADWNKHGKAAGPIRNKQMIVDGKPDIVIALPGGKGTVNMIEQANMANIEVIFEDHPYEVIMKNYGYKILDRRNNSFVSVIKTDISPHEKVSEQDIFESEEIAYDYIAKLIVREKLNG